MDFVNCLSCPLSSVPISLQYFLEQLQKQDLLLGEEDLLQGKGSLELSAPLLWRVHNH